MKKYLLFLIMFAMMFIAIGKVSAADAIMITPDVYDTYTGEADSKSKLTFNFTSDYNADSEIVVSFTQQAGVDHFTLDFIESTQFEVVKGKTQVEGTTDQFYAVLKLKSAVTAGTNLEFTDIYVYHKEGASENCEVGVSAAIKNDEKTCADSVPENNIYYNDLGETISAEQYDYECLPHVCGIVKVGETTHYFDNEGKEVSSEEEMIASCKCRYDSKTDKYYDLENKEISKEEYEKICLCRTEDGKDGKIYYCKKGEVCTAEEFENQCPPDVTTGASIPYAAIISGTVLAGICVVVASKRNKFKRI